MVWSSLCRWMMILCASFAILTACSNGGSDSNSPAATKNSPESGESSDGDSDANDSEPRSYFSPGEYATIADCIPFEGSEVAEMKIVFINLDGAPYFESITNEAVEKFRTLSPWDEFFQNLAFYKVSLNGAEDYNCQNNGGPLAGSGLSCDKDKIHQAIDAQCNIDDVNGVMKVVIAPSDHNNSAGEIIYIASRSSWDTEEEALEALHFEVIHEVSHDLGLADLSGGGYRKDGYPVRGWPSRTSREFLNLDGPGCSKWCDSFKPASEYVISESAQCQHFDDRNSCLGFHRNTEGECEDADGDGHYDCCAWSDEPADDYFGGQCTPVWGSEDIGLACLDGAGCYYGGAHGNNSWRPVRDSDDSIMYSHDAEQLDSVSARAIRDAMRCCASTEDSSTACTDFRTDYADLLNDAMVYKQRIGSCGVVPAPE